MIALDREMPETCLECPCLQTYISPDDNADTEAWIRFCAANCYTLYHTTAEEYYASEKVKDEWIHFPKFEVCPWVDVSNAGLKWTMTYPDDYDDEERWHHNMAGFGGDY